MTTLIGILFVGMSILYVGQLISVVNFPLAQRLGLQESADDADPIFARFELRTAQWDLFVLWLLPVAGVLMLTGHPAWPLAALSGGAFFVDTGGREGFKWLACRDAGLRVGSAGQRRLYIGTLILLIGVGGLAIAMALFELA